MALSSVIRIRGASFGSGTVVHSARRTFAQIVRRSTPTTEVMLSSCSRLLSMSRCSGGVFFVSLLCEPTLTLNSFSFPTDPSLVRENFCTETLTIRNTTNKLYHLNKFRVHLALLLLCFVKLFFLALTCHCSEKESVVSSQRTRATNVGNETRRIFSPSFKLNPDK